MIFGIPLQVEMGDGFHLEPGQDFDFELNIDPNRLLPGTHYGGIIVSSNDPRNPEITIPVISIGAGEQILTSSTTSLAIPDVQRSEEHAIQVQFVNHWNRPVSIDSIETLLDCLSWSEPNLPVEIASEDTITATFSIVQSDPARFAKSLFIVHYSRNDLHGSLLINTSAFDAFPWPKAEFQPRFCILEAPPDFNGGELDVNIRNDGESSFTSGIRLRQTGREFEYDDQDQWEVAPGSDTDIQVMWSRLEPNRRGCYAWLEFVNANDPRRDITMLPIIVIPIEAEPLLEIIPNVLDFGDVSMEGTLQKEMTIRNLSDVSVDLSIELGSYLFEYGSGFILGENVFQDLAPGADTSVNITFYPFRMGTNTEELHIEARFADGALALRNTITLADVIYRTEGIPDFSEDTLYFELDSGEVAERQFIISNRGERPFVWESGVAHEYHWLEYDPAEGEVGWREADTLQIRVNAAGMRPGRVTAYIRCSTDVHLRNSMLLVVEADIKHPDGLTDPNAQPFDISLGEPFPNPFNSTTRIIFSISRADEVSMMLFDPFGREVVNVIPRQILTAGSHQTIITAEGLASGYYLIQLEVGSEYRTQPVMILK